MSECNLCGVASYTESDPLATTCAECAQEREVDLVEGAATGN